MALLILLIATSSFHKKSRAGVPSIFILFSLLFLNQHAEAGVLDFMDLKKAKEAYENGDYENSAKLYESYANESKNGESYYNAANGYYKQKKYKEAIESYKKATFEVTPPETYYVPLFYKVKENTKFTFEFVAPYPVEIDPSRRIKSGDCRIYTRNEIQMYHYSYVRADIESKINNSSACSRLTDLQKQETINHFNKCNKVNDGAMFLNNRKFELIEVENKFNIEL